MKILYRWQDLRVVMVTLVPDPKITFWFTVFTQQETWDTKSKANPTQKTSNVTKSNFKK